MDNKPVSGLWYSVDKVGPPPYDKLCVVYGNRDIIDNSGVNHGTSPAYAIAFNQCFRPDICMTQVLELSKEDKDKLGRTCTDLPFEVIKWMIL